MTMRPVLTLGMLALAAVPLAAQHTVDANATVGVYVPASEIAAAIAKLRGEKAI